MKTTTKKLSTKSEKLTKDFDSVKTMRAIRDELSKEIMNMSFEEEKAYLQKILSKKVA